MLNVTEISANGLYIFLGDGTEIKWIPKEDIYGLRRQGTKLLYLIYRDKFSGKAVQQDLLFSNFSSPTFASRSLLEQWFIDNTDVTINNSLAIWNASEIQSVDVDSTAPNAADDGKVLTYEHSVPEYNLQFYPETLIVACSDETTDLTTGTAVITFRVPYACTLLGVRASVNDAPTGADIIVDINDNTGTTIFGANKLHIDAGDKTSVGSGTTYALSTTTFTDDHEITIDIDQVGSTNAGKGLKVTFYIQKSAVVSP